MTKKEEQEGQEEPEDFKSDIFGETGGPGDIDGNVFNIHGHPTAGKTFAALAASQHWPADLEAHRKAGKWTRLDDVVYVGIDRKGTVGAGAYKVKLKYALDMRSLIREEGLEKALEISTDATDEILDKDPNVKYVIYDTITRLDGIMESYCFNEIPSLVQYGENQGEVNAMQTYGVLKRMHEEYQTAITSVPEDVSVICLFHQKTLDEPTQGKAQAKREAKQKQMLLKMGDSFINIIPAITGSGAMAYLTDASCELVCIKKKDGRYLYADVYDGHRAKNRFENIIIGPQDAHMGKLIAKLKEAYK